MVKEYWVLKNWITTVAKPMMMTKRSFQKNRRNLLICNVFASSLKRTFCGEILLLTFTGLLKTWNHPCAPSSQNSYKKEEEKSLESFFFMFLKCWTLTTNANLLQVNSCHGWKSQCIYNNRLTNQQVIVWLTTSLKLLLKKKA